MSIPEPDKSNESVSSGDIFSQKTLVRPVSVEMYDPTLESGETPRLARTPAATDIVGSDEAPISLHESGIAAPIDPGPWPNIVAVEPDTKCDRWQIVGAMRRGESHQLRNLPCQDYARVSVDQNGVFVAAVCDGAGSAPFSREGAQIIAGEFVRGALRSSGNWPVTERGWEDLLADIVNSSILQLAQSASERECLPTEMATTLIGAICMSDWTAVVQVGDGCAALRWKDCDEVVMPTNPQRGEYANSTFFVTSSRISDHLQIKASPRQCAVIAMMTDGLQSVAMSGNAPYIPFFEKMFKTANSSASHDIRQRAVEDFLLSSTLKDRTDDDLTLLLASRLPDADVVDDAGKEAS